MDIVTYALLKKKIDASAKGAGDVMSFNGNVAEFDQTVEGLIITPNNNAPADENLVTIKIGDKNYATVTEVRVNELINAAIGDVLKEEF